MEVNSPVKSNNEFFSAAGPCLLPCLLLNSPCKLSSTRPPQPSHPSCPWGGTADPRQHDQHHDGRSRLQRLCSGAPRGTTAGVRSPAPHTYPPFPKARPACSFSEAFLKSPVPSPQSLVQFVGRAGAAGQEGSPRAELAQASPHL